jgi:sugar/nucleoside kinase (ribokinase family)
VLLGFLSVFGHTNIDYLASVKRLPAPDHSIAFEGPVRALGGTAANIAAWAASLGTPVKLASFVGDDFPEAFEEELAGRGVDTRHLVRVKGAATPACWIFAAKDERSMAFINQGAADKGGRGAVDRAAVLGARVVHLATGPPAYHTRVAAFAARQGRTVAFDPAQELSYLWTPTLLRRMLRFTDVLFLNDSERRIAKRYLGASSDRALLRHADALVLTHGRRGSEYLSASHHERVKAVKARRVVNAIGAGDAFRGGYYAALYRGLAPRERLLWGAAAASFAVETHGGQSAVVSEGRLMRRLRPIIPNRGFSGVDE